MATWYKYLWNDKCFDFRPVQKNAPDGPSLHVQLSFDGAILSHSANLQLLPWI